MINTLTAIWLTMGLAQGQDSAAPSPASEGSARPLGPQVQDHEQLEVRVRELERLVEEMQKTAVAPDTQPGAKLKDTSEATPKGFMRVPGTDLAFKVGGYVKLDVIHDFNEIENRYKFATNSIAVPGASLSRTTFNAAETRVNIDTRAAVGKHEARIFVEGDFYGTGNTFHLRHAFGEIGGFLAGQTWSTYMDLSSRPHTLDFEGPDAELFVRQAMVRWTGRLSEPATYSLALEGASQEFTTTGGFVGESNTPLPDLTGNVRYGGQGGHVQLSGVLRYLEFTGDAGSPDDNTVGWGLALSGKTEVGADSRRLMGQVSFGEGSAHYNQAMRGTGSDAVLNPSGDLDTLPLLTAVLGYEQDWSPKWTSTFAFSFAHLDNASSQGADAMKQGQSVSANLVWHPLDHFMTGVEYLYGERENHDGQDGLANRLQFSFKFLF